MSGSSGGSPARRSSGRRSVGGGNGPGDWAAVLGRIRSGLAEATPSSLADALIGKWWVLLGLAVAGVILLWAVAMIGDVPLPEGAPPVQSSKVYDVNGKVIGSFHGEENRTLIDLADISGNLKQAVLAAEDRAFYEHPGVSVTGIVRAATANFRAGTITQGASTITQQYARTFETVGKQQTLARKLREATLAIKIERQFSKDKILEFYLNTVYFGRGAYGAEAAAQTYFKKPAGDLDLAEAAYLAGIIRSPNSYQVEDNPQGVVEIKERVLDSMLEAGFIEPDEAGAAKEVNLAERFEFGVSVEQDSPVGGYFIEYVRKLLVSEHGIEERDLLGGGLRIHTTMDLDMQVAAEQAVSSTMDQPTDPEVALLAMDPQGRVKAMVGGRVVNDLQRARGTNFAANLPGDTGGRQPGSALKPVALAAFVDEGKSVNSIFRAPSQIQLDSGRCRNADGTPWKVSNFANAGYGTLDMIGATTRSANTVYAQVMDQVVSPEKFIATASKLGIEIPEVDRGCALTLGTTAVTPLEMARAFATLANRGVRPEPLVVERVETAGGEVLLQLEPRQEQVLSQNVADTVAWVLQQNIRSGTGTGARLPWPAMGKTGTAQNFSDASFVGATPELAAAVWMGYPPDPATGVIPTMENVRGTNITGGSFPATIWRKFMTAALDGVEHSGFVTPSLSGQVMRPAPVDCTDPRFAALRPDGGAGEDSDDENGDAAGEEANQEVPEHLKGLECIEPSPEPTPSPCFVEAECPEGQEPTPTPSPSKTPAIKEPCFPFCDRDDPTPTPSRKPTPTPSKQPSPKPSPSPSPGGGGTGEDCFPFCDTGDAGEEE